MVHDASTLRASSIQIVFVTGVYLKFWVLQKRLAIIPTN